MPTAPTARRQVRQTELEGGGHSGPAQYGTDAVKIRSALIVQSPGSRRYIKSMLLQQTVYQRCGRIYSHRPIFETIPLPDSILSYTDRNIERYTRWH